MTTFSRCPTIAAGLLLAFLTITARAEWSNDATRNLPVATSGASQTRPLVAPTRDGGIYVGWIETTNEGSVATRLQRYDASGAPMFGQAGLAVRTDPRQTLYGWRLIADRDDCAILVMSRLSDDNSRLNLHAHRIGPDGELLWGPRGIWVTFDTDVAFYPDVAQAGDGDFVFVWHDLLDPLRRIKVQRLTIDGIAALPQGGIPLHCGSAGSHIVPRIIPSSSGDVIVSWFTATSFGVLPGSVRIQRFGRDASPLWNDGEPIDIDRTGSIGIPDRIRLISDEADGAIIAWERTLGNRAHCAIQRINSDGQQLLPQDGVHVSVNDNAARRQPTIGYDRNDDAVYVLFQQNTPKGAGIAAQKIDARRGDRLWGPKGITLIRPIPAAQWELASLPIGEGIMAFWMQTGESLAAPKSGIGGVRLKSSGDLVWEAIVSASAAPRRNLNIARGPEGGAALVWEESRHATTSSMVTNIFAQNILPDGTLGLSPPTCAGDIDRNGVIDANDLQHLLVRFGESVPGGDASDINGDGIIDADDVSFIVLRLGSRCAEL